MTWLLIIMFTLILILAVWLYAASATWVQDYQRLETRIDDLETFRRDYWDYQSRRRIMVDTVAADAALARRWVEALCEHLGLQIVEVPETPAKAAAVKKI